MAHCLPGMQVWNLLSHQEMTNAKKDRREKMIVSPMTERTQRHWWQEAGSILTARRLSKWRQRTSWSTSREQPGMCGVLQGKKWNFISYKVLVQNVSGHLEKVIFLVLFAAPVMFWHPGHRDRNSGLKRPKLDRIHLKTQSIWKNFVASKNLPKNPHRAQTPRDRYDSLCSHWTFVLLHMAENVL